MIAPSVGRAISQRSRIWPNPRIASSAIRHLRVRLQAGERERDAELGVVARPRRRSSSVRVTSAARMSFVEVLPVEPVMPTTSALERSRTARPIAAMAAKSSSGTSVAAAPALRASSR